MATVVYTVAVTFQDKALADEWVTWLRDGHIAEVLAGGATAAEIVQLDEPGLAFEIRYHFPSRIVFQQYEKHHAPRLRAEGLERFPVEKGVTYRRSVGVLVESFPTLIA